jgi:GT2 family glycosyltransferase
MNKKIGVGIITCNRQAFFEKCYSSVPDYVDELIVVNDGKDFNFSSLNSSLIRKDFYIHNKANKQVGECKNIAMRHLLDVGCDYVITMEDDIFLEDYFTIKNYIEASKITGIQHFNFGFSQKENLDNELNPIYKKIVDYKKCKIVLTQNILGAFTFYTRECLQSVGLHHKNFNKGHGDHPELTYRAYKHGFTTPFWWFADIYDSWNMIKNQSNMNSDSLVRNQQNIMTNFNEACNTFKELHGVHMLQVPDLGEEHAINTLRALKP